MRYPANIRQDPEGKDWVVKFPDLKGTNTGGDSLSEALTEGADCLGSYLAKLLADRKAIPAPSATKRGQRLISVPFWIAPKIARIRRWKSGEYRTANSQEG